MEQQKKQTDNFYIDRIETAVASEEFNKMQNMLEPLSLVSYKVWLKFDRIVAEQLLQKSSSIIAILGLLDCIRTKKEWLKKTQ